MGSMFTDVTCKQPQLQSRHAQERVRVYTAASFKMTKEKSAHPTHTFLQIRTMRR